LSSDPPLGAKRRETRKATLRVYACYAKQGRTPLFFILLFFYDMSLFHRTGGSHHARLTHSRLVLGQAPPIQNILFCQQPALLQQKCNREEVIPHFEKQPKMA
jgi:hypothetical protein